MAVTPFDPPFFENPISWLKTFPHVRILKGPFLQDKGLSISTHSGPKPECSPSSVFPLWLLGKRKQSPRCAALLFHNHIRVTRVQGAHIDESQHAYRPTAIVQWTTPLPQYALGSIFPAQGLLRRQKIITQLGDKRHNYIKHLTKVVTQQSLDRDATFRPWVILRRSYAVSGWLRRVRTRNSEPNPITPKWLSFSACDC